MVTIHRGAGWKIAVYAGDHGIPHFHVEGPGYRCSVSIETGEIIIGSVPTGVLRDARMWAQNNREQLMSTWQELNG